MKKILKSGKLSIVMVESGASRHEPSTHIKTALKKYVNQSAKYFPDTSKGKIWAMAYFDYLENNGNAYNSQEFRDYLKENGIC